MNPINFINLEGQKFVRLLVLDIAPVYNKRQGAYWLCRCDCGAERIVLGRDLRTGKSRSCGCLHHEELKNRVSGVPGECAFNQCFNTYKRNASKKRYNRQRTLIFELDAEQFRRLTQSNCFYCDAPPSQIQKVPSGNGDYVYNGIDRIDSSKGYILENCVPCCGVHNRMKLDMSTDEFISACRSVVNHFDAKIKLLENV